jgi:competence protein ComEC
MARALVLGENDLDPDDDAAFRLSGLSHLLAVSGTHLVFAVVALVRALAFFLVRIEPLAASRDVGRIAAAFGALLALLYADFAGGSGSAWRAAWMLSAAFGVRALGRRPRVAASFGASLAIGVAVDPLAAYDVSFLLSAAATSGLVVFGQPLGRRIQKIGNRVVRFVLIAGAATLTSMIPCAPLLASLSSTLTIAGLVANVLAAPFGEVVALPICLLHPLTTFIPPLEKGLALVGSGALLVVRAVARGSATVTWLQVPVPPPTPWHFAVLIVGAVGAWLAGGERWGRRPWILAILGALWLVEVATIHVGHPRGVLRVTVLDVGQGDANLVDLPDGSLMLIDAGGFMGSPVDPGRSVVAPVLRMRRRDRIDVVVLSHPHPDHFGGLASALAEVRVGELWDTGQGRAEGAGPVYAALLDSLSARGVSIVGPAALCDRPRRYGEALLRVLGPCPGFEPHINANDNSFVIHVALAARAALLTGDAELHEEEKLVQRYGDGLRADFLKVGHHGSRTSTNPAFVRAVRPTVATISCGVRNRYGHPHAVTLETLASAHVRALRLDRSGSVEWKTDGRDVFLRVFAPN